jgi:hypothetical protein
MQTPRSQSTGATRPAAVAATTASTTTAVNTAAKATHRNCSRLHTLCAPKTDQQGPGRDQNPKAGHHHRRGPDDQEQVSQGGHRQRVGDRPVGLLERQ